VNTLGLAAPLTLAGGFLDAFTYVGHGQVFANAMTGNVIFLGVFAAAGEWDRALRHVAPLAAFFTGVFLAHVLRLPAMRRRLRSQALACLGLEILFLIAGSLLPTSFPDLVLVPGIALVAAMQNSSFDRLESWSYNSVMTTNNLRRCAEGLFTAALRGGDPAALRQARLFGIICLSFLAGAIAGAFSTARLHNTALWVPIALLSGAFALCLRRSNGAAEPNAAFDASIN
jgi:uncharacterized membrane protein YoaK (UPF0700 family)